MSENLLVYAAWMIYIQIVTYVFMSRVIHNNFFSALKMSLIQIPRWWIGNPQNFSWPGMMDNKKVGIHIWFKNIKIMAFIFQKEAKKVLGVPRDSLPRRDWAQSRKRQDENHENLNYSKCSIVYVCTLLCSTTLHPLTSARKGMKQVVKNKNGVKKDTPQFALLRGSLFSELYKMATFGFLYYLTNIENHY